MPAKSYLEFTSRKKYGHRADKRPQALRKNLQYLAEFKSLAVIKSDKSPRYSKYIEERLPTIVCETHKGRLGCVVGQGELKKEEFNPLFSLNHTCARIRDLIKRLSRRTWCTTKLIDRLQMFMEIFTCHFNKRLAGEQRSRLV